MGLEETENKSYSNVDSCFSKNQQFFRTCKQKVDQLIKETSDGVTPPSKEQLATFKRKMKQEIRQSTRNSRS
jgi:hypothetical protein